MDYAWRHYFIKTEGFRSFLLPLNNLDRFGFSVKGLKATDYLSIYPSITASLGCSIRK